MVQYQVLGPFDKRKKNSNFRGGKITWFILPGSRVMILQNPCAIAHLGAKGFAPRVAIINLRVMRGKGLESSSWNSEILNLIQSYLL